MCSGRPAFAPLYANQYAAAAVAAAAAAAASGGSIPGLSGAAQWPGGNLHPYNSQYHSLPGSAGCSTPGIGGNVSVLGGVSGGTKRDTDCGGSVNSGSRKEKRQYKKRKHKTPQRDKPYASPGMFLEIDELDVSTAGLTLTVSILPVAYA